MRRLLPIFLLLVGTGFFLPTFVFADSDDEKAQCIRDADSAGNTCLSGADTSGCAVAHALALGQCSYNYCVSVANAYYGSCGQPGGTTPVTTCGGDYTNDIASCDAELSAFQAQLTPASPVPTPLIAPPVQPATTATASQNAISTTYSQVMSQGIIFANICSSRTAPCDCRDDGNCTVGNILQVGVNIVNFIIAISGSLVLAMFIYGGVLWIFSAGNEGMVKKGRDIIEGAVIGLFIILGAYAAVAIIVSILTKDKAVEDGTNLEDLTGGAQLFNTENP